MVLGHSSGTHRVFLCVSVNEIESDFGIVAIPFAYGLLKRTH
jgi:hypothetical protein